MKHDSAFTLVEIAIVLIIIGLIIGGILTGMNLIRSAQVQSVITDVDRYKKAVQLFKEKYHDLPGDMLTATNFWGTDTSGSGCPTNGYSTAGAVPKTATCNGDGDGKIDTPYESFRAWQQLADAGFIDGSYSGIQGNNNATYGPYTIAVGIDVPASKLPNCGWMIGYISSSVSTSVSNTVTNNQGLSFLQLTSGGADVYYPGCLSPTEAAAIDSKIDDGMPLTGNVMEGGSLLFNAIETNLLLAPSWNVTPTTATQHSSKYPCAITNKYNTSNSSTTACDPFFNLGF